MERKTTLHQMVVMGSDGSGDDDDDDDDDDDASSEEDSHSEPDGELGSLDDQPSLFTSLPSVYTTPHFRPFVSRRVREDTLAM